LYCVEKNFSIISLKKVIIEIDKIEIPKFPYTGQFIINQGLEDGKKIGFVLKELEKEWLESDFNLKEKDAILIINKVKKLNVLNI